MDLKNFNSHAYEVVNKIPRFVKSNNFASPFGLQWNTFQKVQLDSYSKTKMSEDRVAEALNTPLSELKGLKVLEAGSGAGRFTEILLKYGAIVYSFDLSNAVEANYENNMPNNNLTIFQGDIEKIPFNNDFFDLSLCLGVMQHTRNFNVSLTEISRVTKSYGLISFDHYRKHIGHYTSLYLIYWVIIKNLPQQQTLNQNLI